MAATSSAAGLSASRALSCEFVADGEHVHTFSISLDASLDTPSCPLGALERALDNFKQTANEYLTAQVEKDRAANGGTGSADDGWHELNDETGENDEDDEDEEVVPANAKRKADDKTKRARQ